MAWWHGDRIVRVKGNGKGNRNLKGKDKVRGKETCKVSTNIPKLL